MVGSIIEIRINEVIPTRHVRFRRRHCRRALSLMHCAMRVAEKAQTKPISAMFDSNDPSNKVNLTVKNKYLQT